MFSLSDRGKVVGGLPDVVTIMEKKVCLSLLCASHTVVKNRSQSIKKPNSDLYIYINYS